MERLILTSLSKLIEEIQKVSKNSQLMFEEKHKQIEQLFNDNSFLIKNENDLKFLLSNVEFYIEGYEPVSSEYDGILIEKETPTEMLDWLIGYARNDIIRHNEPKNYLGCCKKASQHIDEGIKVLRNPKIQSIKIDTSDYFGKRFQHTLNIVDFNGEMYIVDPTFVQFFSGIETFETFKDFIPDKLEPLCKWILSDEEKSELAKELIIKGYVEATPKNLKNYFDSFVLANDKSRKSLNDKSVTFSSNDYIEMFRNQNEKIKT